MPCSNNSPIFENQGFKMDLEKNPMVGRGIHCGLRQEASMR